MTPSDNSDPVINKIEFGDFVQTFQIEDLAIRGRLVRLSHVFENATRAHDYPIPLARFVGETMALTTVLASALKYNGVFTLQAQGDGPVPLVMADMTSEGGIRAYAKSKEGADLSGIEGVSVPHIIGAGRLAFTVDQGPNTERYQGITELDGATLTECAQNYFRNSEQLDTAIIICSERPDGESLPKAAALMLQRLPTGTNDTDKDENWRRAVVLMSSITTDELLDSNLAASQVLYRLYHEDGVRLYDAQPLQHECRCSADRVSRTLKSFPRDEITDMADDGVITVTCEFCRTDYVYNIKELYEIILEAEPN